MRGGVLRGIEADDKLCRRDKVYQGVVERATVMALRVPSLYQFKNE